MSSTQTGGEILGTGVNGCVISPPTTCVKYNEENIKVDNHPDDPSLTVAKIMLKRDLPLETRGFEIVRLIDPEQKFTRNKFHVCKDIRANRDILQCKNIAKRFKILFPQRRQMKNEDLASILMQYQGKTLEKVSQEEVLFLRNPENTYRFLNRIAIGIKHLHDNQRAHLDLHVGNILFNFQNNEANIIDFGRLADYNRIRTIFPMRQFFYLYPFEYTLCSPYIFPNYVLRDIATNQPEPGKHQLDKNISDSITPEIFRETITRNINDLSKIYDDTIQQHSFFKFFIPYKNHNIPSLIELICESFSRNRSVLSIMTSIFNKFIPVVDRYAFAIFIKIYLHKLFPDIFRKTKQELLRDYDIYFLKLWQMSSNILKYYHTPERDVLHDGIIAIVNEYD